MKEILAAFATEIFRPVVTLLLPGFWGLSPLVIALFLKFPHLWNFVNSHKTASSLAFIAIATACGMIFENLGGQIEECYLRHTAEYSIEDWYEYLRLAPEREPIGFRFIRTYVLRMKFELGMATACPMALLGTLILPISFVQKSMLAVFILFLFVYFLWEGRGSVTTLVRTHREMLKEQPVVPIPMPIEIVVTLRRTKS